jgi:hypothetical protein
MTASRQFDFSTRLFKRNLHAPVAPVSIAVARFSLSNQCCRLDFLAVSLKTSSALAASRLWPSFDRC